ncbi:LPS assembly protein LptD [Lysobacter humi (ex Lee et al. 2017)]
MRTTLRLLPLSLCIAMALPAMAAEDEEDWSLCPIRDAVPAFAGVDSATDGNSQLRVQQPTDIEGDALEGIENQETLVQGNVELRRGDQFLGTDRLVYNQETGTYRAEGSIRYQDAGMRIVAKSAEGNQETDTHTINDLDYQLMRRRGSGGAEKIALAEDRGSLYGATYSTCDPGQRAWELRANRIDIDMARGRGVARNATLRIGKVPVLYVPWFPFPTDDRRQTGLLYPSISLSGRNGFDWRQPIYLNLAPNYDATLHPRIMTKRGAQIGGEFRWLYERGRGIVSGNWMPKDELPEREAERYLFDLNGIPIASGLPDENRGQFGLNAIHNFSSNLYATANLGWVSDTHYLEDFSNSLYGVASYFVRSETGLFARGRYWNAGITADHYQLADYTLTKANLPYDRLPRLYAQWGRPFGRWLEAGVDGELVRFSHADYRADARTPAQYQFDGTRFDLKPYIAANLEGASWFVRPKLAWRYTAYELDNRWGPQVGGQLSPNRSLPITSVDAGMFFDRETEIRGERYLQTLEPRLYYLRVPYRDQSGIPLFDTAPMTFSWGQLFRDNRYTGPDRQTDANQLTIAATTRFISEADGRERLSASLGQIRYFEDSRVVLPGETAVAQGKSAWVAEASFSPSDRWIISGAYQWDPKLRGQNLASLRAHYLVGEEGVVNLGYRYRRNPSYNASIPQGPLNREALVEQVDFSFLYPINRNWSVVGRYYYSLLDKKELETIGGVQWESCCLAVRLVSRRYLRDRSGNLNDSLQLEVELKGLGSAGQKAERVLRRAILGYDRDDLYLVPPSSVNRPDGASGNSPTPDPSP